MQRSEAFAKSLKVGTEAERKVRAVLESHGWVVACQLPGKDSLKDMSVWRGSGLWEGAAFRVEVKCEDNYASSGRLCVEMYQDAKNKDEVDTKEGKKWSGLLLTEATIVVHTLGEYVAMYRAKSMMKYIAREKRERTRPDSIEEKKWQGADGGCCGVLVKIEHLRRFKGDWFDYLPISRLCESVLWDR